MIYIFIDLLDDVVYRRYLTRPETIKETIELALSRGKNTIIIDEVQKVPAMLSMVHQ
ncbi:MAG: hypothetical protein JW760_09300 [Spirochaetales bacterium]|nr:hypothetical protein [Spirochaetales bacterium]